MEWAEETIVRLRALWDEGQSTAEIGRRLGVSKMRSSARRTGLICRPGPRRSVATDREAAPRPSLGTSPRWPARRSRRLPARRGSPGPGTDHGLRALCIGAEAAGTTTGACPAPAPRPYGRVVTCCWPIGEPGTRSFRFCDAKSVPGKPYCSDHAQLAYVRLRDRREDAA